MGFKSDGIRWKWNDTYNTTTATDEPIGYTTTWATTTTTTTTPTTEPINIKASEWKSGDKITINSPIDIIGEPKGWICPRCGRANAPWVSQCSCSSIPFMKINTTPAFTASPCQTCSNNPANGGSGNCNCTLGTCPVTC